MNLVYLTNNSNIDIHNWSGLESNITNSLIAQDAQLDIIGSSQKDYPGLFAAGCIKKLWYYTRKQRYYIDRTIAYAQAYAGKIHKVSTHYDAIFTLSTINIAYLETSKPIILYTDATFASVLNYYKEFTNLSPESIRMGHFLEQRAIDNASLIFYASEWAAQSAIDVYDAAPEKIRIIPFGANLNTEKTLQDIHSFWNSKSKTICKLLFIGVDWHRKGGATALKVAAILNERGLPTELHVAGLDQIPEEDLPDFVYDHGFISKSTEEGQQQLEQLYAGAHFFILPSIAECFGVVFSEANSFGVPAIAKNTGGVSTAIRNNHNGFCFDLDAGPEVYADYIYGLFTAPDQLLELSLSSFKEYESRLNWRVSGKKMMDAIRELSNFQT